MRPVTPRLRHAAAASLATLALVSLSACGGDDKAAKASDGGATSSAASSSATSSGASSSGDSSAPPATGSAVSAEDMANLVKTALSKATTAHIVMSSTESTGVQAEGDADFGPPIGMQLSMTIPEMGQAQAVLVDQDMYIKLPQLGDKYIKFALDDPSGPLAGIGDLLDPSKLLNQLADAITEATYQGREDVGGDQADHYSVTIDSAKLLGGLASAIPGGAASSVPKTATVDMWLGTDGLIRQVKTGAETGDLTMNYTKWGEEVDITAPPSDEVTEMPGEAPTA